MTDSPSRPPDDAEALHERAERQVRELEARIADAEQHLEQQARDRETAAGQRSRRDRAKTRRD